MITKYDWMKEIDFNGKKLTGTINEALNINHNSNLNTPPNLQDSSLPTYEEVNDPRKSYPTYQTGKHFQDMTYINDEKFPTEDLNMYFTYLPTSKVYDLDVETIELRCPDCHIAVSKNQIKSNRPILFDYFNNTMRVLTPSFEENRILLKDGSSVVNGYNIYDFDNNLILVKSKVVLNSIENKFDNVSNVNIYGDYCTISFENGLFDGKDLNIKARSLNKVSLGKSFVKSVKIDAIISTVDRSEIIVLNKV